MEISRRSVRGVTVIDLTGRFIVSPAEVEVASLRTAISELTTAGCVDVAVNLAGLTHTGLDRVLERCETEAQLLARALQPSPVSSNGPARLDVTAYA